MATTPLSRAMQGKNLNETQAKSALTKAVEKLKRADARAARTKAATMAAGSAAVATAEMQGAVFAGSFAEGRFGRDKVMLGPVDLRLGAGLLIAGFGVHQALGGDDGTHALAIGNGLMGSAVASLGLQAGQALAEKKTAPTISGAEAGPELEPDPAPRIRTDESVREVALDPVRVPRAAPRADRFRRR